MSLRDNNTNWYTGNKMTNTKHWTPRQRAFHTSDAYCDAENIIQTAAEDDTTSGVSLDFSKLRHLNSIPLVIEGLNKFAIRVDLKGTSVVDLEPLLSLRNIEELFLDYDIKYHALGKIREKFQDIEIKWGL